MPIFSQILEMSFPADFKPAFENTNGNFYIHESVLENENVNKWTQMITITGTQGLAANPSLTPKIFAERLAAGFQRACPTSYIAGALPINKIDIGKSDGFAAVVSCGTSPTTAGQTSESALIVVIKGTDDYYTVQWAERTPPSATPIPIDAPKWLERAKELSPIKLCSKVAGEVAPYPSCINMK